MGEDDSVFSSDYDSGALSSISGASAGACAATAVIGPFESSGMSNGGQGGLEGILEGLSAVSDASFLSVIVVEPPPVAQMSPALRSILKKKYEPTSQDAPQANSNDNANKDTNNVGDVAGAAVPEQAPNKSVENKPAQLLCIGGLSFAVEKPSNN